MFDDDDEEPPEADLGPEIPDSTPDIPKIEPDIPDVEPELPDPSKAPPELRRTFFRLVAIFNVALLATALGLMLVGFQGRVRDGGAIFLIGVASFAYGYWLYLNRPDFETDDED